MKHKLGDKLYYSMGEVAKAFDVNPSLIRFWEKEFEEIQPKKNAKGNRKFSQEDLKTIDLIYHLVKERGFTLEGAKTQNHRFNLSFSQRTRLYPGRGQNSLEGR